MALSTLGTDPDYASLLGGGNRDPRLLMAQKLMDVGAMPTNNSTQSSFWANLLNQGARGALGGYLYEGVQADREKEAAAQETAEKEFKERMLKGPPGSAPVKDGGGGGTAPRADAGGGGTSGGSAGGDLVAAVHHLESRGRTAPGIYGDGGAAAGPMQVHAGALADVNRAQGTNYTHEQLAANPELGLKVGAAYLAQLRQQFGRDDYALGAYNAGPGAMRAAIASGQGVAGLPARTQQYVSEGLSRMRGRQADATPAPGSDIDALMAGVNAPKPRGIQLAERVAMGGGSDTATDSPTPILPAPRAPVSSASLDGPPMSLPLEPPPAEPSPAPAATVPQPPLAMVPPPQAADVSQPTPAIVPQPTPASVPQPDAAIVPQPEPALVPDNPLSRADPASLAAFNGQPQPDAATVPQPAAASVPQPNPAIVSQPPQPEPDPAMIAPAGSGETGGQPTIPPPVQGPPIPPGPVRTSRSDALARKLVQSRPPAPPAGGGDNATEALNTASLAAARAGQNFDPRAPTGPTGPQLAAPLMSWAGNLTAAGAPLLTPAGGPTGPQLAGPLVTPAGDTTGAGGATTDTRYNKGQTDTTDTSATGGQSKGAASSAPAPAASTADSQAQAEWYLKMAREAQASRYPGIRATAGVLEAQGQALQRRIDRQDALDQQLGARRDAASERAADRAATREDRQITHQENLDLRRQTAADTAAGRAESAADRKERIELERRRVELEEKKANAEHGPYSGKGIQAEDSNHVLTLGPKIANGTATDQDHETYRMSYNRLRDGALEDMTDPKNPNNKIKVRLPGQDMSGYPLPRGGAAADPNLPRAVPGSSQRGADPPKDERKAAGFASRMEASNRIMAEVGDPSAKDLFAGQAGTFGNFFTSEKGQRFKQAAMAWVRAKLRDESGADIPEKEAQREYETYFPIPGDSPAVLKQKQEMRERETGAMRTAAGRAYVAPEPPASPATATTGGGSLPPEGSVIRQGGRTYKIVNGQAVAQ